MQITNECIKILKKKITVEINAKTTNCDKTVITDTEILDYS